MTNRASADSPDAVTVTEVDRITSSHKYPDDDRSDIFQLGRWSIDSGSGLYCDDGAIRDMTTIATLSIVLLAGKFLEGQKHSADCQQIETLAADYATHVS